MEQKIFDKFVKRELEKMDNKKINLETEFKNKLKQFKTIASELSSIWEQIDARYHFAPKYTVKYPFKDSFDEVASDISLWYETNFKE